MHALSKSQVRSLCMHEAALVVLEKSPYAEWVGGGLICRRVPILRWTERGLSLHVFRQGGAGPDTALCPLMDGRVARSWTCRRAELSAQFNNRGSACQVGDLLWTQIQGIPNSMGGAALVQPKSRYSRRVNCEAKCIGRQRVSHGGVIGFAPICWHESPATGPRH